MSFSIQVEGSVVHIMKALASHPSAALSLIEDDSLQVLFEMVANGSLAVFAQFREGLVPLHTIQLHRHAMQVCRYFWSPKLLTTGSILGTVNSCVFIYPYAPCRFSVFFL